MKVLVISGSPRMEKGYTNKILAPFIKGMKEAGADVELIYVQNMKINPCLADESCMDKTPGICIHNDDMKDILSKLSDAELWVLATPVYYSSVTGQMKIFIDRMLPMGFAETVIVDGRTAHLGRKAIDNRKVALVSTCGLYEMDNFDSLMYYIKAFCWNTKSEFAGAVLRPHPWAVDSIPDDIIKASKDAGYQLISEGKMSQENLDIISRPLIPLEEFIKL